MRRLKRHAACLTAVLALTVAGAHSAAADVVLKNETEEDFKAIYCVNDQGATKEVTGALAGGASVTVTPNKLPEYECNRIAVLLDGEEGWQFYHEPEPAAASEIIFAMDKPNPQAGEYPSLLISSGGEDYLAPAGMPLGMLVQVMEFGLDEARWKEIAVPGVDPMENDDFVVSFADQSWDMHGDGMVFKELVPGMQLAASLSLETEFSNTTVLAVFEGLKSFGCVPTYLIYSGNEKILDDAMPEEARWDAVNECMAKAADGDGGAVRIVFGNEGFTIGLVLDLDTSEAVLSIERKKDAAFG